MRHGSVFGFPGLILISLVAGLILGTGPDGVAATGNRWVHPACQDLPVNRNGPFLILPDSRLMTVDAQGIRTSKDEGRTWSEAQPVCRGINPDEPGSFQLVRTHKGVLVIIYLDMAEYNFTWDDAAGEPKADCKLEVWAIRSGDSGKTWTDRQRLLDGYNANFFGFIQTRSGRLVATLEHLVRDPGRWVACSFVSDDDGKTWQRSNLIDLGGHGHHDGAVEPTVAELSDGRLLMLIRTNLDRFWQAISEDGGRYWRIIQPSAIDASSSPGYLLKLRSGRLFLVWNRLNPEGRIFPKAKPSQASEGPISWHREELSVAFSDDDGKSWTPPLVIARHKDGHLCYPYAFERRPGELWVVAGFAGERGAPLPLRLKATEDELFRQSRKGR